MTRKALIAATGPSPADPPPAAGNSTFTQALRRFEDRTLDARAAGRICRCGDGTDADLRAPGAPAIGARRRLCPRCARAGAIRPEDDER